MRGQHNGLSVAVKPYLAAIMAAMEKAKHEQPDDRLGKFLREMDRKTIEMAASSSPAELETMVLVTMLEAVCELTDEGSGFSQEELGMALTCMVAMASVELLKRDGVLEIVRYPRGLNDKGSYRVLYDQEEDGLEDGLEDPVLPL